MHLQDRTPAAFVTAFNVFKLEISGKGQVRLPGKRAQALIAFLILSPDMAATRDKLAEILWGSSDSEHSRNSLRQTLALLRRALAHAGPELIIAAGDTIALNMDLVASDVHRFERSQSAEPIAEVEAAAALYTGPFLDGFYSGSPAFDDWAASERTRLAELAVVILDRLARQARGERGLGHARRALAIDPMREASYRLIMELLAASGHRDGALRTYETCRQMLKKEFGIEPSQATRQLRQTILESQEPAPAALVEATPVERASPEARPSIAVLRFVSLTGTPQEDSLARGIFYDLITSLSQHKEYVVVPGGVLPDNGSGALDLSMQRSPDVGRFTVTGGVQHVADRMRVTVHLMESATGHTVWGQRFEGGASELLEFQDRVTASVALAACLELQLIGWRVRDRSPPGGPEVRRLVNQAMTHYYAMTRDSLSAARSLALEALHLEARNARAMRTLAVSICVSWAFGGLAKTDASVTRALELAHTAVLIVPDDEISRVVLSYALLCAGRYEEAFSELQHAIELNPAYSSAYGDLAEHYALQGRTEEALEAARKAIGMSFHDPIEFWRHHSVALAKFAAGNDWGALEMARKVMRSKPGFIIGALHWAASAAATDNLEEAERAVRHCLSHLPDLRLGNASPGLAPRYVSDHHHKRFLEMLRKAGLPE